jgi:hypothetical protein
VADKNNEKEWYRKDVPLGPGLYIPALNDETLDEIRACSDEAIKGWIVHCVLRIYGIHNYSTRHPRELQALADELAARRGYSPPPPSSERSTT